MATHSSVLAWRIPGTGEPDGLLSMGLHRVGHNWSDLAAAAGSSRLLCDWTIATFSQKAELQSPVVPGYRSVLSWEKTKSERGARPPRDQSQWRYHHPRPGATNGGRKAHPQAQCWGSWEGSGCGKDANPAGNASRAEAGSGDGPHVLPKPSTGLARLEPSWWGARVPRPTPVPTRVTPFSDGISTQAALQAQALQPGKSPLWPPHHKAGQPLSACSLLSASWSPCPPRSPTSLTHTFSIWDPPHSLFNTSLCTKNNLPTLSCRFSKSIFKMLYYIWASDYTMNIF